MNTNSKRMFLTLAVATSLAVATLLVVAAISSRADSVAYWRFENGTPGRLSGVGAAVAGDASGQGNEFAVAADETQALYTADVPYPSVPQTGAKNTVAAQFNFSGDFFTRNRPLNTHDFSPGGSQAWTVELSFKMLSLDGVNRLGGRDGNTPGGETRGPLQILVTDNDDDQKFDIRLEIIDGSGTFRDVASQAVYNVGQWYNIAATATASTLSLYVDQLDGKGYQLAGTRAINGALTPTPGAFAVGRGWNGRPTDWIDARIDEVRVSDSALQPSQFLFVSPTGAPVTAPRLSTPLVVTHPKISLFMGADPHAAFFGDRYWLYVTSQDEIGPRNPVFYAYSSADRKVWTKHGPILQFKDAPWIYTDGQPYHGGWAPAVVEKDGKYFFYYAVGPQNPTPSRTGVAVGDAPGGPFRDKGQALLSGGNGFEAIDPMVFKDPVSGKYFLYAGGSAGAKLRVFEMAPDMMSFAREVAVDTPPQFTEGPFMHFRDGTYYLSYSHGAWNGPSYSVHYATAKSPAGPWEYRGPILVSDQTHKGPGHHSFVQNSKTGEWFIVYHRWQHPRGGNPFRAGSRSLAIDKVNFGPNGEILPITMTDTGIPTLQEAATPQPPLRKPSVGTPAPLKSTAKPTLRRPVIREPLAFAKEGQAAR